MIIYVLFTLLILTVLAHLYSAIYLYVKTKDGLWFIGGLLAGFAGIFLWYKLKQDKIKRERLLAKKD
jgi:hypothetical protein